MASRGGGNEGTGDLGSVIPAKAGIQPGSRRLSGVLACHNVSGEYDFLLQVVARDLNGLGDFARDVLRALPGVKEINSSFALKTVKSAMALPIPGG